METVLDIGAARVFRGRAREDLPHRGRRKLHRAGRLYVACNEPSQVLRLLPDEAVELLIWDEEAHQLCHPTNLALRDNVIFTTNLGRWHITAIETEAEGMPLYGRYGSER